MSMNKPQFQWRPLQILSFLYCFISQRRRRRGMAYPAVAASHNDSETSSFHDNSLTPVSSFPSEGKKCFYMMEDRYSKDHRTFKCIAMDKSTGETKESTISPALKTNEHQFVLSSYTAVAVGPTIYMIGGCCLFYHCPENVARPFHVHADVRVFNPLRPEDGWRDVAPMHIRRWKPAAVVVDGMIYVFGGSDHGEDPEDGEWYDPKTDTWHLFPAKGYIPSFPRVQASYVDPIGAKKVLVNSFIDEEQTLYMFHLDAQRWEIVTRDFEKCMSSCLVVGNVMYVVLYHDYNDEKRQLRGYHLIHKQWYPVELPEIKIHFATAQLIASGSDRLCVVWHNHVNGIGGIWGRMECLELRLNESYTTGLDGKMIVKLRATKVWSTYFDVEYNESHKWMIAL